MKQQTLEDQGQIVREKGSNYFPGSILKGTLNQAPIKIKVSSIPAKHQNIIYRSFSQPAFGDSTSKFHELSSTSKKWNPGPGNYNCDTNDSKIYSKKGLGSFASSTKLSRLQRVRSHGPGPGTYAIKSSLKQNKKKSMSSTLKSQNVSTMNSSRVTNTALLSSQIQNRDIFKNQIKNAKMIPGPGRYEYNPQGTFQNNLKAKQQFESYSNNLKIKKSASLMNYNFKSKLDRFTQKQEVAPCVGQYQLDKEKTPYKKPIKYDQNKHDHKLKDTIQKKVERLFASKDQKNLNSKIGPGYYETSTLNNTQGFKIQQSIHDRFGNLKPIYAMAKTLNVKQSNQQYMGVARQQYIKNQTLGTNFTSTIGTNFNSTKGPDSMFKSNTKRTQLILQNKIGPCKYNIDKQPHKKSHLINFSRKWVG